MSFSTCDLCDRHGATIQTCSTQFRSFGGRAAFSGPISTVRCYEDNVQVKARLSQPGDGRVLVVDGGGSLRIALLGDMVAGLAARNGWAGIVLNACVRDVAALGELDIGIKALGSNPRPSRKQGNGEADVVLVFGDAVFRPGTWLYADGDGIVLSTEKLN